uniref:Uncharacterized protein n=1 Tax=Glossina brevipalpis TaxID=37001 RepID=A0A1A9VZF5_9MUSC
MNVMDGMPQWQNNSNVFTNYDLFKAPKALAISNNFTFTTTQTGRHKNARMQASPWYCPVEVGGLRLYCCKETKRSVLLSDFIALDSSLVVVAMVVCVVGGVVLVTIVVSGLSLYPGISSKT